MGRRDLFTGRSGQLALMSEFLIRGINVAIPDVDVGDDIVVVRDDNDILFRVQVKTANALPHASADNFSAQFNISMRQLEGGSQNLIYAFIVRRNNRWGGIRDHSAEDFTTDDVWTYGIPADAQNTLPRPSPLRQRTREVSCVC